MRHTPPLILLALLLLCACAAEEKKLYKQAVELQNQHNYSAAVSLYQRVIQEHPDSTWALESKAQMAQAIQALVSQGDTAMKAQNYAQALKHYQSAAKFDSAAVDGKISRALQLNGGSLPEAKRATGELPLLNNKAASEMTDPEIEAFVEHWRQAWQNTAPQNSLSGYRDLYSPRFYSHYKKRDYKVWMQAKMNLATRASELKIGVENIRWKPLEDKIEVRFEQNYDALGYSDLTEKTLLLENTDGRWLIVAEEAAELNPQDEIDAPDTVQVTVQDTASPPQTAPSPPPAEPQAPAQTVPAAVASSAAQKVLERYLQAWEARQIPAMEALMHTAYHGADGKNKTATLSRLQKEAALAQARQIDYQIRDLHIQGERVTVDYLFNYYDTFKNEQQYHSCLAAQAELVRSDGKWYLLNESHRGADC